MKALIFFFGLLSLCFNKAATQEKWVVEPSSRIVIKGSSNVNEFQCELVSQLKRDTLKLGDPLSNGWANFTHSRVRIRADGFDCHHNMITRDMKKTLQVEKHPEILIQFLSLKGSLKDRTYYPNFVKGKMRITIAGVTQPCDIEYDVVPIDAHSIELIGSKLLCLQDFKLETPSKLMGLIKVDNNVHINFRLVLRELR